jgi:hypothetical protein
MGSKMGKGCNARDLGQNTTVSEYKSIRVLYY